MKRLKNIYRKQISEHCGDPLAHPEYAPENVKMNYNDYEGRMAKQNLYKLHIKIIILKMIITKMILF